MKLFLKVILPLVVIAVVFAFVIDGASLDQEVKSAVTSDDGSAELVAFYNALSDGQFEQASLYVQPNCTERRCFVESLGESEIAAFLKEMCKLNVCDKIELDESAPSGNDNVSIHTAAFLDSSGHRARLCVEEACRAQKTTFSMRTVLVDGKWYVTDQPLERF